MCWSAITDENADQISQGSAGTAVESNMKMKDDSKGEMASQ